MSSPTSPHCCTRRLRWLAVVGLAIVCGVGVILLNNRSFAPNESPSNPVPIGVDSPTNTDKPVVKPTVADDEWANATVAKAIAAGAGRKELAVVWDELVAAAGPDAPADRFAIARRKLFDAALESTRVEAFRHLEAGNYERAFGVVRTQSVEWFKKEQTLGQEVGRAQAELREAYRYLDALATAAGPAAEPAPEPRGREPAPEPRPIPDGCETDHSGICVCAAADDERITRVMKLIEAKKYAEAAAELKPLAENLQLPATITKAITVLQLDLLRLTEVSTLKASGDLPASTAADNMPVAVKKAIARVEALQKAQTRMASPDRIGIKELNEQLESFAAAFGADFTGKLRVEQSVKMFLEGQTALAIELLEGDIHENHARQLLADLHTLAVGGGSVENAQLAKLVPTDAPPTALKPVIPSSVLANWKAPKHPAGIGTTLTTLEQQARRDVALSAKEEMEKLEERITTAIKAIQLEGKS